jgi:hypothetical protein
LQIINIQPQRDNFNTFLSSIFSSVIMSSKLDQSLEDISKSRRQSGRGNNRRRSGAKPTTTKAPVGGIKKSTKPARNPPRGPAKGTAIGPTSPVHESKIIVSGLVSIPYLSDM